MKKLTRTVILLAAIFMLSACSIFKPLPTIPALLTLEPEIEGQATTQMDVATQVPALALTDTMQATPPTVSDTTLPSAPAISPTSHQSTQPTSTSAVTSQSPSPTQPPPTRQPVPKWKGIPVMPAAYNLSEDASSYSYDISNSINEVRSFYDREMPEAGWKVFTTGEGETGNQLLIYDKDSQTATIALISQGGVTRVLIILQ